MTCTRCYDPLANDNFRSLDLYLAPHTSKESPLVVFIHGGAWRTEDKADYKDLCLGFNKRGISVASVNYRLSLKEHSDAVPQVQHPDHIMDVGKAIEYLYHSNEDHYNPNQIYLVGHSAGAHIALMLLLDTVYHHYIAGVIGVSGIYDIPLLLKTFPSYTDFIVQAFGADQSRFFDASPISKTSTQLGHKPIIIAHSPQDTLIDHQQPECMVAHLQQFHPHVVLDMSLKGDHYEIMKTETLEQVIQQMIQK